MHRNKKIWGQVFLKNKNIQKRISSYINDLKYENMVEVGPGEGAITQYLDMENKNILLIEIDSSLINFLISKFPKTKVIHGDFLTVDIDFGNSDSFLLFGNIPYNITSLIFMRFLRESIFKEAVFMIQKECFNTISAIYTSREYSSFTVLVQTFCSISRVLDVSRKNFFPTPKVDSVVVHLSKNSIYIDNLDSYSLFLRRAFSMPRKTLWNNLRKITDIDHLNKVFDKYNLDKKIRPDYVPPDIFLKIFLGDFVKEYSR